MARARWVRVTGHALATLCFMAAGSTEREPWARLWYFVVAGAFGYCMWSALRERRPKRRRRPTPYGLHRVSTHESMNSDDEFVTVMWDGNSDGWAHSTSSED